MPQGVSSPSRVNRHRSYRSVLNNFAADSFVALSPHFDCDYDPRPLSRMAIDIVRFLISVPVATGQKSTPSPATPHNTRLPLLTMPIAFDGRQEPVEFHRLILRMFYSRQGRTDSPFSPVMLIKNQTLGELCSMQSGKRRDVLTRLPACCYFLQPGTIPRPKGRRVALSIKTRVKLYKTYFKNSL